MIKSPQEWLKQADYDIKTAGIMFDNKRYFYAVYCEGYTFEEQGGVGMDKNAVYHVLSCKSCQENECLSNSSFFFLS